MAVNVYAAIFAVLKMKPEMVDFEGNGLVVQLVISPQARRPSGRDRRSVLKVLFNMYYVYIIESLSSGIFYKGSTADYIKRLAEHNENINTYTKGKGPWQLIFVQEFESKTAALIQEKKLKRCNKEYLRWLVTQPVNILNLK